jgi:hypothetical protein
MVISRDYNLFLMSKSKLIKRDELVGALTLVILFISIVGGKEIGNYYANYQEMTRLKVLFEVTEEELSRYIVGLVKGEDSDLEIGLIITAPGAENVANIVTDTPDYVRKWLIGLTVSPVVVNQPEASDVELVMYIENSIVDEALYTFPKQKISFISYTDRLIQLEIDDIDEFSRLISAASKKYGGEIEVTFTGRAHMHLLFLDTWLPFSVTRYPIVEIPHLEYVSSEWRSYTEGHVSSLSAGEGGYIIVDFKNPTRIHSLSENITCQIFKVGETDPELTVSKNVPVPPNSKAQYTFSFTLSDPGEYEYRIVSIDTVLLDRDGSQVLSIE